jgi:hypothetical protein
VKWGLPVQHATVSDDTWGNACAMAPIELDWSKVNGVACKLEWNGLSMNLSGDTVDCAISSVRNHVPDIGKLGERLTFSFDGMVIKRLRRQPQGHAAACRGAGVQQPADAADLRRRVGAQAPLRERASGSACPDRPDAGNPGRGSGPDAEADIEPHRVWSGPMKSKKAYVLT